MSLSILSILLHVFKLFLGPEEFPVASGLGITREIPTGTLPRTGQRSAVACA